MQLVLFNQYVTLFTKKCVKVNGGGFQLVGRMQKVTGDQSMLPWAKTKNSWKNHKRYIFRGIRDLREQEISLKLKFLQGEMFSR